MNTKSAIDESKRLSLADFAQLKASGIVKLQQKLTQMQNKFDFALYTNEFGLANQFEAELEVKYWRAKRRLADIENEIASLEPLWNLWVSNLQMNSIAEHDRSQNIRKSDINAAQLSGSHRFKKSSDPA